MIKSPTWTEKQKALAKAKKAYKNVCHELRLGFDKRKYEEDISMFTDLHEEAVKQHVEPTPAQQAAWAAYQQAISASPVAMGHPRPAFVDPDLIDSSVCAKSEPRKQDAHSEPKAPRGWACVEGGHEKRDVNIDDLATLVIDGLLYTTHTVKYAMRAYLESFK